MPEQKTRAHLLGETARSVSRERTTVDCYRSSRGTEPRRRTGPRPRVSSGRSTTSECERIKTLTETARGRAGSCKSGALTIVVTASVFATEVYFRPRLAVSQSESRLLLSPLSLVHLDCANAGKQRKGAVRKIFS